MKALRVVLLALLILFVLTVVLQATPPSGYPYSFLKRGSRSWSEKVGHNKANAISISQENDGTPLPVPVSVWDGQVIDSNGMIKKGSQHLFGPRIVCLSLTGKVAFSLNWYPYYAEETTKVKVDEDIHEVAWVGVSTAGDYWKYIKQVK